MRESLGDHLRLHLYRYHYNTRLRFLRGTVDKMLSKMYHMDDLLDVLRHSCNHHLRGRSRSRSSSGNRSRRSSS